MDPRYTGPTPVSASTCQGLMHTLVHAFFHSTTQLCAHPELCSEHPEVSLAQSLLEVALPGPCGAAAEGETPPPLLRPCSLPYADPLFVSVKVVFTPLSTATPPKAFLSSKPLSRRLTLHPALHSLSRPLHPLRQPGSPMNSTVPSDPPPQPRESLSLRSPHSFSATDFKQLSREKRKGLKTISADKSSYRQDLGIHPRNFSQEHANFIPSSCSVITGTVLTCSLRASPTGPGPPRTPKGPAEGTGLIRSGLTALPRVHSFNST